MNNVPQHPGGQQQGLAAPVAPQQQGNGQNPYFVPNAALGQSTGEVTGATNMKLAQAAQAGAQAGKEQAKAEMFQTIGGLGPDPREVQAQQELDQVTSMLQQGASPEELSQQVPPELLNAAMQNMQRIEQQTAAQFNAQGSLGQIPGF